jgi:hypothetical protein
MTARVAAEPAHWEPGTRQGYHGVTYAWTVGQLVRLVTDTLGSRGKTERLVCRSDGELRLMRLLDRETTDSNRAFLDAERGAVLAIDPMPPNDRISPVATVGTQPIG